MTPDSFVPAVAATDLPRLCLTRDSYTELTTTPYQLQVSNEALYYLKLEGSFDSFALEDKPFPYVPAEYQEKVGLGEMKCPVCEGRGTVLLDAAGKKTGLRISIIHECSCVGHKYYLSRWNNVDMVPLNYRGITLSGLEALKDDPRFISWTGKAGGKVGGEQWVRASVEELFGTLRKYSDKNYLLVGRAGTGKTTCLLALYQQALYEAALARFKFHSREECLWKVNAKDLSEQFVRWATSRNDESRHENDPVVYPPLVTAEKIRNVIKQGYRPRLFLEELDKFKLDSDFQRKQFWGIFEALEPNNGQIVATSNLTLNQLLAYLGDQHGEAIIRRITGEPNGILVDCSNAEIKKSWETVHTAPVLLKADGVTPASAAEQKAVVAAVEASVKSGGGSLLLPARYMRKIPHPKI